MNTIDELKEYSHKLKVLYVEDDQASREQMSQILKLIFNSVDVACDGDEAYEMYKKSQYDIVITDINMPRMDGLTLSNLIKQENSFQKIIIISAHDSGEYLLPAIRSGVNDFILKPVEMNQLQSVLYKVCSLIHSEKKMQNYQQDLEEKVLIKTAEIHKKSVTDELTGLMNRSALNQKLKDGKEYACLLLNIDNFDSINITYGYSTGDEFLKKIAVFLSQYFFNSATLYHVGADEFAFLFTKSSVDSDMETIVANIKEKVSKELFVINNLHLTLSFTIVFAEGRKDILKKLHIALKETRKFRKNEFGIYKENSEMEERQKRIQHFIPILRESIKESKIIPYFQAIFNNKTNEIVKFECLARLNYDDNIYPPSRFIEIAELTDMLPDVTKLIAEQSFKCFEGNEYSFSINISEKDLQYDYLIEFLPNLAAKYNIDPSRVILEVLEGISVYGAEQSLNQLVELKNLGFLLAIDDFGAQNSNFERVHKLAVDFIKIDGSFIKNIAIDETSYKVSKTIADFSKSIGAKVIAEYVHDEFVQEKVLELGIDFSQGYYFSEPKPYIDCLLKNGGVIDE